MELYLRVALGIIAIYAICYLSYILVKALILYRRSLHTQQRLTTNGAEPDTCPNYQGIGDEECYTCKLAPGNQEDVGQV